MNAHVRLGFAICVAAVAMPAGAADRAIYRCEIDGSVAFSDRPCAPQAERYELDQARANVYEAPPASKPTRTPAQPSRSAAKGADPAAELLKQKQTCERIAQGLKDIRSKQRAGYSAEEGERLRARQERLKSQLRMARCG